MDFAGLAADIKRWGRELGFDAVRITDTDLGEHPEHLRRWLDAGHHGSMEWMQRHADLRCEPERLVPGTLRIISVRMDYRPPDTAPERILASSRHAYISRYALGRDYHKTVRRRLAQLARRVTDQVQDAGFRAFTDSAPVLEKGIAERAGLGWIGKNTLLLHRDAGSWFFLGELFTDLPLPVDPPDTRDHCGSCDACLRACPTGAFVGPRQLDAARCISYLTIEHDGPIDESLRPLMGNRVFGCDDCQLVCPWNKFARDTREDDFHPRHDLDRIELLALWRWDEDAFLEHTAGSPLRRAGYERFMRNLAVALGNAEAGEDVVAALEAGIGRVSALVDEHIRWALQRQREALASPR